MSAFSIESYEPRHRDAYLGLMHEAWGVGAMSGEVFDWWFHGNPAGSLMSVAVIDEEVVGAASHSLARLWIEGAERLAQYSVHAVTSTRARGLGIFRALERHHEELGHERGSACMLCFANASTQPLFLGPLGWSQIDRRRVWGRPLRGAVLRRLGRQQGSSERGGIDVQRIERFGSEHEAAYRAVAPKLGDHLVRDANYLQWRYLQSPRSYSALESANGFAVLGHVQRDRVSTALLMEFVTPADEARALLARCIREARDADILVAVPSPTIPRALLAHSGFAPLPKRLNYVGKGLSSPLVAESQSWSVSLGDTDFF